MLSLPPRTWLSGRTQGTHSNAHFADETVLVHGTALLAVGETRRLGPHLLDVLKHHIAVAVEGFYARQQLAVVADGDQDLCVAAHGGLED